MHDSRERESLQISILEKCSGELFREDVLQVLKVKPGHQASQGRETYLIIMIIWKRKSLFLLYNIIALGLIQVHSGSPSHSIHSMWPTRWSIECVSQWFIECNSCGVQSVPDFEFGCLHLPLRRFRSASVRLSWRVRSVLRIPNLNGVAQWSCFIFGGKLWKFNFRPITSTCIPSACSPGCHCMPAALHHRQPTNGYPPTGILQTGITRLPWMLRTARSTWMRLYDSGAFV